MEKNKKRVKLDGRGLGAAPLGPKHITLYSVIKEMNHSFLYEGGNGEEDNQPIPFNQFIPFVVSQYDFIYKVYISCFTF